MQQTKVFNLMPAHQRRLNLFMFRLSIAMCLLFVLSSPLSAEVRQFQVLDAQGSPLSNAVITWVNGKHTTGVNSAPRIMDQVNRTFLPKVVSITVGDMVAFPNSDNIRHHVYSFSPAKTFELKLYSGTPKTPIRFDKPGIVVLGCNIHDSMIGYIYVANSDTHGVTDQEGKLSLDITSDQGDLILWHPGLSINGQAQKQYDMTSILQPSANNGSLITIKLEP